MNQQFVSKLFVFFFATIAFCEEVSISTKPTSTSLLKKSAESAVVEQIAKNETTNAVQIEEKDLHLHNDEEGVNGTKNASPKHAVGHDAGVAETPSSEEEKKETSKSVLVLCETSHEAVVSSTKNKLENVSKELKSTKSDQPSGRIPAPVNRLRRGVDDEDTLNGQTNSREKEEKTSEDVENRIKDSAEQKASKSAEKEGNNTDDAAKLETSQTSKPYSTTGLGEDYNDLEVRRRRRNSQAFEPLNNALLAVQKRETSEESEKKSQKSPFESQAQDDKTGKAHGDDSNSDSDGQQHRSERGAGGNSQRSKATARNSSG